MIPIYNKPVLQYFVERNNSFRHRWYLNHHRKKQKFLRSPFESHNHQRHNPLHETANRHLWKIPKINRCTCRSSKKKPDTESSAGMKLKQHLQNLWNFRTLPKHKTTIKLAEIGRCILTPDIFDKINEPKVGFRGEIHLTNAPPKMDSLYGVIYKIKSYYIKTNWTVSRRQSNLAFTMINS